TRSIVSLSYFAGITLILLDGIRASTEPRTVQTPGCRRPAKLCHIDHSKDFALGGPSCNDNLCNECARHHTLKHATNWHVEQLPGGILKFTSPGGKTYDSRPPSRVAFIPTDDGGLGVAPF
ncbi:hypothetical protein HDC37_003402, partial [Microbacterium sp. AK009]|uniref:HNH endonuclease signature motif containing protein n=1 Tax=Microbacterium sp. AK009 TaxID=2723068 RepID=UPI0017A97D66